MTWLEAAILGLVEGLTEFLPVSSTGHLILTQRLLGIVASEEANAFVVCVQPGAILAVLLLCRAQVAAMARGLVGRDEAGRRLLGALLLAFLPAAVVGLLFHDWIEERLFGLWPVVVAWILGGVAILLVARTRGRRGRTGDGAGDGTGDGPGGGAGGRETARGLAPVTWIVPWAVALGIGIAQCLALWPGTSRSLVTIVAGVVLGLSMRTAVEFSFLLGAITLSAATALEAWGAGGRMLASYGPGTIAVGLLLAAISAALAVQFLVRWLERHGLALFGWWRLGLGAAVAALLLTGVLEP